MKWQDMDKAERTERRPLRRIPLSDCTNTGAAAVSEGVRTAKSSTAKSVARPTKPHPSKKRKPEQNSSSRSDTGSNDIRNAPNPSSLNDAVSPPPPKASTPVRASKSSSNLSSGKVDDDVFEPLTVYNRRNTAAKRKGKEKAVAEPLSCPPLERMRNELNKDGDTRVSKSYTAPNRKKQRVPKNDLSQDFIEEQKAYFAEVDAFELPEEVVSDSELE